MRSTEKSDSLSKDLEYIYDRPYWVIDFLPRQVPPGHAGQSFSVVEDYYTQPERLRAMRRGFADILIRLNCYYDIVAFRADAARRSENPAPEEILYAMTEDEDDWRFYIPQQDSLIAVNRGEALMTVYSPGEDLLSLLKQLSLAAGLFLWKP